MRPRALAWIAVLTVLIAGCGGGAAHHPPHVAPDEPPAVSAPAGTAFGATVNSLFNLPLYTPAQVGSELAAFRATGATLARSDVLWEKVEVRPPSGGVHHYSWAFDDVIAASLAAHGLTWLPILDYAANWAKADPAALHSPPRSAADFATFAGAFAARYGPGGTFWRAHPELHSLPTTTLEVWNEPDGGFWYPAPNAAAYADMYLAARSAIDAVAPGTRVLIGGLTHAETFLGAMLAARPQVATHIDGVAIHIYEHTPARVFARVRAIRAVMTAQGLGSVPLYITEMGWSTQPAHNAFWAPARLRPAYIARTVGGLGRSDCGIAAILVYSWLTPERDPRNLEDWYGINPPPGTGATTSPDTNAFADAIRVASAGGAPTVICGG